MKKLFWVQVMQFEIFSNVVSVLYSGSALTLICFAEAQGKVHPAVWLGTQTPLQPLVLQQGRQAQV